MFLCWDQHINPNDKASGQVINNLYLSFQVLPSFLFLEMSTRCSSDLDFLELCWFFQCSRQFQLVPAFSGRIHFWMTNRIEIFRIHFSPPPRETTPLSCFTLFLSSSSTSLLCVHSRLCTKVINNFVMLLFSVRRVHNIFNLFLEGVQMHSYWQLIERGSFSIRIFDPMYSWHFPAVATTLCSINWRCRVEKYGKVARQFNGSARN